MKVWKYQALLNPFLVVEAESLPADWDEHFVRNLCDTRTGLGADGLVVHYARENSEAGFRVRMFNSDGSEFEKSGNGLRIFIRYLWDNDFISEGSCTVKTLGGSVSAEVSNGGEAIALNLGSLKFNSLDVPLRGPAREVLKEELDLGTEKILISACSIGNPLSAVFVDRVSPALAQRIGPKIEHHPSFPKRINVAFVEVVNRNSLKLELWERGAGYTLSSGICSAGAAGIAHRLGLCEREVVAHMPGGSLRVSLGDDYAVTIAGAVQFVAEANMSLPKST